MTTSEESGGLLEIILIVIILQVLHGKGKWMQLFYFGLLRQGCKIGVHSSGACGRGIVNDMLTSMLFRLNRNHMSSKKSKLYADLLNE